MNVAKEERSMIVTSLEVQTDRDRLSQAILDVVSSLPELHRRIFTAVHYEGRSVEQAGRASAIGTVEAACILAQCEHRLRAALRAFRREDLPHDAAESRALADLLQA